MYEFDYARADTRLERYQHGMMARGGDESLYLSCSRLIHMDDEDRSDAWELSEGEGTFLLCTFWLIDNLAAMQRFDEAEALMRRMEGMANHLGLFSEEYDMNRREHLGNFPQAFTHIGYINSVITLQNTRRKGEEREKAEISKIRKLLAGKIILNDGEPRKDIPPGEIAVQLKNQMNVLRGAFFDVQGSRVAYERMQDSPAYREYLELSCTLKKIDLNGLKTREERIAFWVNMYNVIVIHGVIELDIKDSVKEVRNIFRRIRYRIGDMFFSPEEIEHGILRGNRRPPTRCSGYSAGMIKD